MELRYVMKECRKYPECFPDNIEELILADGAGANSYTYYRISRTGLINRDEFIGTYEKSLGETASGHNRDMYRTANEELDIGDYSTSGYEKLRDAKRLLKCIKRYEEGPIIMEGWTDPECGLSMRTKDSKTRKCRDSHIDWWIYKEAHPEVLFKKIVLEQEGGT